MKPATKRYGLFSFLLLLSLTGFTQQNVQIGTFNISNFTCPTSAIFYVYTGGSTFGYNPAVDTVDLTVFWGDGTSTLIRSELNTNAPFYGFSEVFSHVFGLPGTYYQTVVATMPDGLSDTLFNADTVMISEDCIEIDGFIYTDENGNCTYDGGEYTHQNVIVQAKDANDSILGYGHLDSSGHYALSVPDSNIQVNLSLINQDFFQTACPPSGSYTFNVSGNQSFDFGIACDSAGADLTIYPPGGRVAAPGDTGIIAYYSFFEGCPVAINDTVILTLDPRVSFLDVVDGPQPDLIQGNALVWYHAYTVPVNSSPILQAGLSGSIRIITDTTAVVFDTTTFNMQCTSDLHESNYLNNYGLQHLVIGGPYDPNNKEVAPAGRSSAGLINQHTESLLYTINFQNTGTDTAKNVYLIDTITNELLLSSIRVIDASDPVEVKLVGDDKVRFNFNNIQLPDSHVNEPASKGFVRFKIDLKDELPLGTVIRNRAGIYFDYNAPIITNYTVNTLHESADQLLLQLQSSNVTCKDVDEHNGKVVLNILSGNPPYEYEWSTGAETKDIDQLEAGTYTVTVTDSKQLTAYGQATIAEDRKHDNPIIGAITGPEAVEAWKSYIYSVNATSASTFAWLVTGGEVLSEANNQAEILWYAGPAGNLHVTEMNEYGCTADEIVDINIQFVGLRETDELSFKVYPNPTRDKINIEVREQTERTQLRLYDLRGSLILDELLQSSKHTIDLRGYSAGVYWLNISAGEESAKVKVMVQ